MKDRLKAGIRWLSDDGILIWIFWGFVFSPVALPIILLFLLPGWLIQRRWRRAQEWAGVKTGA